MKSTALRCVCVLIPNICLPGWSRTQRTKGPARWTGSKGNVLNLNSSIPLSLSSPSLTIMILGLGTFYSLYSKGPYMFVKVVSKSFSLFLGMYFSSIRMFTNLVKRKVSGSEIECQCSERCAPLSLVHSLLSCFIRAALNASRHQSLPGNYSAWTFLPLSSHCA